MNIKTKIFIIALALTTGTENIAAQEFNATFTSELHSDFKDKNNFVNLLRLDFAMPIAGGLSLKASTMSLASSNDQMAMGDMQGLSNIYAENFALAPTVVGLTWQTGRSGSDDTQAVSSELFVGVHNMDEYLFASPSSGLFLNASCGFYPTIALNYPVACFPSASMGAAYTLNIGHWTFHTSVYNGIASTDFGGSQSAFRFCPKSDGILSTTQMGYEKKGCAYNIGMAHYDDSERYQSTYWAYGEQKLSEQWSLLAQYSLNPSSGATCRSHVALGGVMRFKDNECGLYANYLDLNGEHEWTAELTWKIPVLDKAYVQPALSYFNNSQTDDIVGMMRFGVEL